MNIDQFKVNIQDSGKPTIVMGILNVTPDSFSDGGLFSNVDLAVKHALKMAADGADIIDIGGESTRPGSNPVSLDEELERVIPVIRQIREKSSVCISIDTYKSLVAREAVSSGADIINDISGFKFDLDMVDVARDNDVPVIIMHIKGTPRNMQKNPSYEDCVGELVSYFRERVNFAHESGMRKDRIILDPGIGFGKRLADNYEIIRDLRKITGLGYPVLLGPSRKSFLGTPLNLPEDQRIEGTAAAVTAGILNGARIVRVHDVSEMKRVAVISDMIRGVSAA